jgi:hypothetical protein
MVPRGKIVGRTSIGVGKTEPDSASVEIVTLASLYTIPNWLRTKPALSKTFSSRVEPFTTVVLSTSKRLLLFGNQVNLSIAAFISEFESNVTAIASRIGAEVLFLCVCVLFN